MSQPTLLTDQKDILNELRRVIAKAMRAIGPAVQATMATTSATDKYTSFRVASTNYPEVVLDVMAKATAQPCVAGAVEVTYRLAAPYIVTDAYTVVHPDNPYPKMDITSGACELYAFMRLVAAAEELAAVYGVNGFTVPADTCIVKW